MADSTAERDEEMRLQLVDDPGGVPFDDAFEFDEPHGLAPANHDSGAVMQQRGIAYPTATPLGMKVLRDFVIRRFGGNNEGILTIPPRAIRGGSSPSLHNWGMAWDWRWANPGPGRAAADAVIEFCLANHAALGIQAIHDYPNTRLWKNHTGWKKATSNPATGFGQSWAQWLHIERNWKHANLTTPIEELLGQADSGSSVKSDASSTPPETTPLGLPKGPLKLGDEGANVARVQDFLRAANFAEFTRSDGVFGPRTEAAVIAAQTAFVAKSLYSKKIDGVWGPLTAAAAEKSIA